ncbi:MAG: arylesterase [Bryobacteraceae bacterium]|nr:arylesterase [Bryobacteraceae bacterium]
MSRLFLSITLLVLVSCAPPAPAPVPEVAPAQVVVTPVDTRPVIVAFGDSLSAGYGEENGKSFPDFLQQLLDQRGYRYRVANQGISGDTTTGGRARVGVALALKPAVVILELGGNDGLRGLALKQTRENLEAMATEFSQAGAKLLIAGITLPPNYGADYIRDFERIYSTTAKQHRAPLIPFLLSPAIAEPGAMQADGIHPTAKGNQLVAQLVFRYLEPLLKR